VKVSNFTGAWSAGLACVVSMGVPAWGQAPQAQTQAIQTPAVNPQLSASARAATLKPVVHAGYTVARTSDGHPDLNGVWTNATTTRLERAANLGDKLILSDAEMAAIEKDTQARNARQNAPTSQTTINTWTVQGKSPDNSDECRSGSRGAACGYNAGWTDPGDWVMRVNGQGRTSFVTYPANGRMPARVSSAAPRPRAEAGEDGPKGVADNPEDRSLAERCLMFGSSSGPVMTPTLYNNTYQFVQTPDGFVIWVEMVHDARIVKMNVKHRTDGLKPWMGDSIGWWDGDTLVVETVGFNAKQNIRGASPNMKLTERFTRVAADRVHYAFDVQDPATWVEPWGGEYEFAAVKGSVYEYACHEGNYGLSGILSGAREEDRVAALAAAKPAKGRTAAKQ
jgi:hypothetical protein